jgi:hypothetical protein
VFRIFRVAIIAPFVICAEIRVKASQGAWSVGLRPLCPRSAGIANLIFPYYASILREDP